MAKPGAPEGGEKAKAASPNCRETSPDSQGFGQGLAQLFEPLLPFLPVLPPEEQCEQVTPLGPTVTKLSGVPPAHIGKTPPSQALPAAEGPVKAVLPCLLQQGHFSVLNWKLEDKKKTKKKTPQTT